MQPHQTTRHVGFIGNYLPRHCGIATFTTDLCEAIATEFPATSCIAGAINDRSEGYNYPSRVRFEIDQNDPGSYLRAADFLHINNVEVISVQHEFGIYGGMAGDLLLDFLECVKKPVVTTLHTILQSPDPDQLRVMKELDRLCARFIVMAERGRQLLVDVYGVDPGKIDLIPHGVIDMPFVDSNFYKDIFGAEGKTVLLTFGLLSENKGIETAIRALPAILKRNPDLVYMIVGATHPHLIAREGEIYRDGLAELAKRIGVSGQVVFHNHFVTLEELKEFIGGSDVYLTPYRNVEQITSGTLAYAFGAGKAVVSTPYWHALELLGDERGIIVPFDDVEALSDAVNDLLAQPTRMTAMRKRAWKEGRKMVWPEVARRYMESFDLARACLSHPATTSDPLSDLPGILPIPPVNLDHLYRMTDHTGIFQHAIYHVPNYHEAYCTDDNARAFIFTIFHQEEHGPDAGVDRLACSYLAFLWYAFDANTRRFRNFMGHDRKWARKHRLRGQPCEGALGRRDGARQIGERRLPQSVCAPFPTRTRGGEAFQLAARVGFHTGGDPRISARLLRRSGRRRDARSSCDPVDGFVPREFLGKLAVVRADRHLRQRQVAARVDSLRKSGSDRDGSPLLVVAACAANRRRRTFFPDRMSWFLARGNGQGAIRPATGRGARNHFGVHGGV
jgi:glycosyltransferase involved in cell wall biosynthesis